MKYFIMPITLIVNNDYIIDDLLKNNYPDVYKAIIDFNINQNQYYQSLLFHLLNEYNLPYYLILKRENNKLYEIESNSEINIFTVNILDYGIKDDRLIEHLNDNYVNSIINLYTNSMSRR